MGRGANNRVAQIEESEVVRKLLERVDMLESAKVASFQQSLPPLMEDPNQYISTMPQTMEEVNFMGRQGANPTIKVNFLKVKEDFKMLLNNFREEAAVQYPPGFEPGAKLPNNEGRPSQEDAIEAMFKKMDEYMKSNNNQMKSMEYQIGQLATTVGHMQNKGKFPSTTEPNPKEHCKAIELRSGTKYQGPSLPSEDNVEEKAPEIEQEAEDDEVSEKEKEEEIAPLSEDEEEKGMRKSDKEELKKKLEKKENAQPVPKWKRVRGLKEKMSDEIECDAWGIPKIPEEEIG
ncbi:hypothetical protein ACS0TY_008687 [Phlomoides rotata]